jgi:predicted Zn-dependent protease
MQHTITRVVITGILVILLVVPASPALAGQKAPKNSDIDNIGNRDINKGIGNINLMSLEKEIALGRQLSGEIERQVKLVEDPTINEYVNRVGQNLVRNSDAKVPFTIKVVESDEINAFALLLLCQQRTDSSGRRRSRACRRHGP